MSRVSNDAPPIAPHPDPLPRARVRGTGKVRELLRRLGPAGPFSIVTTVTPPLGALCLLGFVTRIAPVLRDHPYAGPIIGAALQSGSSP